LKKTIISIYVLIYLLFATVTLASVNAQTNVATVSVDPSVLKFENAQVGQQIKLNINVDNVQNLWGWSILDFTFNSSMLKFVNIAEGSFLKNSGATTLFVHKTSPPILDNDVQNIACALGENTTVSGSGTLATITFKVLSAGSTDILMKNVTLRSNIEITPNSTIVTGLYEEIASQTINGQVTVTELVSQQSFPYLWVFVVFLIILVIVVSVMMIKKTRVKSYRKQSRSKNHKLRLKAHIVLFTAK
jgi:hypothetical protein